jgi:membrane dipeptidase
MLPIFDAHLDLSWNALSFNRDLTLSIDELNRSECHMTDVRARGHATVTLPELCKANVPVCVATILARSGPDQSPQPGYKRTDLDFSAPSIAYATGQGQLAYYRLLEQQGHVRFLKTRTDLQDYWSRRQASNGPDEPLGIILSMEGTDPIVSPEQAEAWWHDGLRAAGLAHYGRGQYAYGTGVSGPLSSAGIELLKVFERLGIALDVTHLCDESMYQALDLFDGPVLASHHNCRTLVPGDRQLADNQIRLLIERDAVIGMAMDAWMLYPGWERGVTSPEVVSLEAVADHIDYICQLAGSARHVAIGSDLDGGFGTEQTPHDLKTIADLQKLIPILSSRGYKDENIRGIFHGNWLRFFLNTLPDG